MEQMYQDYKDIAEFRIVYISEAHPADGRRPVNYAIEKGFNQPTTYTDRCSIAQQLVEDEQLTIPFVVDTLEKKVEEAYRGLPNRVFLVRKDGKLAVAAERGPRGFPPALKEAKAWLAEYKKTGKEPELPEE